MARSSSTAWRICGSCARRQFLELFGPQGLHQRELFDHALYQPVVHVAPDGLTAKARVREFSMEGRYGVDAQIGGAIYENEFVSKDGGVWKIRSLHQYTTFVADLTRGWAQGPRPAAGASTVLPPDRPPSLRYQSYPIYTQTPIHYPNPVTGLPGDDPRGAGRRSAGGADRPGPQAVASACRSACGPCRSRVRILAIVLADVLVHLVVRPALVDPLPLPGAGEEFRILDRHVVLEVVGVDHAHALVDAHGGRVRRVAEAHVLLDAIVSTTKSLPSHLPVEWPQKPGSASSTAGSVSLR